MIEKREWAAASGGGRVPLRCQRTPNATFDRSFAMFVCNQRDARCPFYGPAYVLDNEGRHFECRKRTDP
jgi:hypothetical protein